MNSDDELQEIWHSGEPMTMLAQVVNEKRTGFDELVRAENMADYVVALILTPLMVLVAWRARTPLVAAGAWLCAATLAVLSLAEWLVWRRAPGEPGGSLRDHLMALLRAYDRRVSFLRLATVSVAVALSASAAGVVLGGALRNPLAWTIAAVMLPGFWIGQWVMLRRRVAVLRAKREQAERLLADLG